MKSFPFDSQITGYDDSGAPIYDRAADSSVLATMLGRFFCDGIVRDKSGNIGFFVSPGANNLETQVSTGYAIIKGRCLEFEDEDSRVFVHDTPSSTYDRIDRYVLRMSLEIDERRIDVRLLSGTPSANPVPPALTRTQTVWELAIADVLVKKNTTVITQANITDNRLHTELCGISEIPLKVFNTTELYSQLHADIEEFKTNEQANFEKWFASLESTLDGDVAGNLFNLINTKPSLQTTAVQLSVSKWDSGVQTVDVPIVTPNSQKIDVEPSPESYITYHECIVRCINQGEGSLTFECEYTPDEELTVNISVLG